MRFTFRIKLFLYFMAITLITSIPTALVTYNYIFKSLERDILSNTKAQMFQIDNNITSIFNQIKENDKYLAISSDITKADESISALFNIPNIEKNKKYSKDMPGIEGRIYEYMESYGLTHPETTYVYLGTKWGGYIQWPDGLDAGKFDPRKRPWYSLALNDPDKVVISEPYTSEIDSSNNVIITASTTVKNSVGDIVGVAGIDVSLEKLSGIIRNIKVGESGYIFLYLKDGTILAHPNEKLNFKNILQLNQSGDSLTKTGVLSNHSFENYNKFIEQENGEFESVIDGKSALVSVYTSPNTGWKMASVIPKSELYDKANKSGYIIVLVTICVLLFVVALAFVVTKKTTKPINELTSLMIAAGNGDLTVRSDINTNDELGDLSNSFNLMINNLSMAKDKINFMAFHDSLTKLSNRTLLMKVLNEQLELSKEEMIEGAVFFVDLDNFKNINDTMGHEYGDKLLIYLAEQFKKLVSEKDIVCRLGGDEFILLLTSINKVEVELYAKRILALFNENIKICNKQMYITASIGVALYPKDGIDANTILKNADAAMYKAKELGKNRYALFDPQMYLFLERKTNIERILRNSIKNNELSIFYQPQYDAESNEVFGFEALLRLDSKELGFIPPSEFIPIAEECGFITELGKWVFSESCRQTVEWFKSGYKFKSISINISSVDLQQPDFLDNVKEILEDTEIDKNIVEFEITETVLMKSLDSSISVLQKLMNMGMRIALDDFGTGYSSLNYLMKIPISTLKVDKSFIDNITSSKKNESIISNIINMAHNMDLKVVAEGVENKEQLEILREKRCDYIQGYYYSKPLPANEVPQLFEGSRNLI